MKTSGSAAWKGGIKDGKGAISTKSGALKHDREAQPEVDEHVRETVAAERVRNRDAVDTGADERHEHREEEDDQDADAEDDGDGGSLAEDVARSTPAAPAPCWQRCWSSC